MIKELLRSIPGIATFPIISLILFFSIFVGISIWAFWRLDKKHVQKMKELPLDSDSLTNSGEQKHV